MTQTDLIDPLAGLLAHVRVVLVRPTHPGNVGAAARVMKNMGLTDLRLVGPCVTPDEHSRAMAAGAKDVLLAARTVDSLRDAVEDCSMVVGATARSRHQRWPVLDTTGLRSRVAEHVAGEEGLALVFGPERTGLENEDIDHCNALVRIDANPVYPSLNLASAVQVISFCVREAVAQPAEPADDPPAESRFLESYLDRYSEWIDDLQFIDERARPAATKRRLRALVMRTSPTRRELQMLQGVLTAAMKRSRDT